MDRITKETWISHAAMNRCIDAVVAYGARYGQLFPPPDNLKARARAWWPNGCTVTPFIAWLESQEIKLPPSPEDLHKD